MRIFLGFLIAGIALAASLWLHTANLDKAVCRGVVPGDGNAKVTCKVRDSLVTAGGRIIYGGDGPRLEHPSRQYGWQDPLAVVLAFAGVGAGVALVASSRARG